MGLFDGISSDSKETIVASMVLAVGASPAGTILPAADMVAMGGIWGNMVYQLAKQYGVSGTKEQWVQIVTICGRGVLSYTSGSKVLTWIVNVASLGAASVPTMIVNAILNAAATYSIGTAFDKMLRDFTGCTVTIEEMASVTMGYLSPPGLSMLYDVARWVRDEYLNKVHGRGHRPLLPKFDLVDVNFAIAERLEKDDNDVLSEILDQWK